MAGIGSLTVLGAVTRKILGGGRRGRMALGAHVGDTDPGSHEAVRQLASDLDTLREEVAGLRREMDETLNRLDFTERLLGQAKERGLLNPPRER